MSKSIIIIGGGVVGVCSAVALQQAGHKVTLVDRKQPGRETSYGNAGVLCESAVVVLNNPSLLKNLPKLLISGSKGLRYSPLFVAKRLGWFIRFLAKCTPTKTRSAAKALRALQLLSLETHKQWIKDAGVGHLLRQAGWLKVFRTDESYEAYSSELELMAEVGSKYTLFERDQIRQLEPGLKPIYRHAILMDDTCSISSPADLTDAYMELFRAVGGVERCGNVSALTQNGSMWEVSLADGEKLTSDDIVVAAGAWSAEVAGWLGYDIPMAWERGYHMHMEPGDGPGLTRAVHDVDGGFVMAPMRQGVRITSGVELVDRDAPKNFTQINQAVADARMGYGMKGQLDDEAWMGRRPTLVDSLPIIGPAPKHSGLWFNFGHQHVGLSMGPGSGLAIAAMINGDAPPLDVTPFNAKRFWL